MLEYMPSVLSFEELAEKAKLLPEAPGIYIHYDKHGKIIYVGKAKKLKNRVSSYFRNLSNHSPKTARLVSQIADFQTIITKTEAEALLLENEKIKLHQPKYNIRLKDDKNYPYIKLSLGEDYPRLSFVRSKSDKKGDKSKYFGPYGSNSAVWKIINTANKIFKLPTCKSKFPRDIGKVKPCLYHHLGRCCGVCTGSITKEEYAESIERLIAFLKYDYKSVIREFEKEMTDAAERLDFETATKKRDDIKALSNLMGGHQIVKDLSFSADAFGVWFDDIGGCINMLSIRGGRIIDSINFHFGADEIVSGDSFSSVLTEIYRSYSSYPKKILLSLDLKFDENEAIEELISERAEHKVEIVYPDRGDGAKIVKLCEENAKEVSLHKRRMQEKDETVLISLASALGLEVIPEYIESIDISNSGKDYITASVIAIENAKFSKKKYKSFNIDLDVQNDVASMYEAISRRIKRYKNGDKAFSPLPDLILVDGGKTQVNAVNKALRDEETFIPVFGMVKNDYHKTSFLTDGENEISIIKNQELFRFIYSIQEEVHRFAIGRMDIRRRKSVRSSSLTDIKGIGDKKATLLLKEFKSIKNIKTKSLEELMAVKGISKDNAENIIKALQFGAC